MAINITLDLVLELDIAGYFKYHESQMGNVDWFEAWSDEMNGFNGTDVDGYWTEDAPAKPRFAGSILPRNRWAEAELDRLFPDPSPRRKWLMEAIAGEPVTNWAVCADALGKIAYIQYIHSQAMAGHKERRPDKRAQMIAGLILVYNGVTLTSRNQSTYASSFGFKAKTSGKSLWDAWNDAKKRIAESGKSKPKRTPEQFHDDMMDAAAALHHPRLTEEGKDKAFEHMRKLHPKL